MSGSITDRLFITYRAPAGALRRLVPAPLELDEREGCGFVSVCAVEIVNMGLAWTPRWLRWDNRELLYRIAARYRGASTFLTLQSHVSSRRLALLGRHFSHYRPRLSQVQLSRSHERVRFSVTTQDGAGDACLDVSREATPVPASVFASDVEATQFLLGMDFSVDVVGRRVRAQYIDHTPWRPCFAQVVHARFAYLEQLQRRVGVQLTLDSALVTGGVQQVWRAAQWL
ncbi:MAG TPA: DUF2071 domain-containing protein [Polyangiales bacterium]